MDEALQNDCAGYPRYTINQKGAKQLVVGQSYVGCCRIPMAGFPTITKLP